MALRKYEVRKKYFVIAPDYTELEKTFSYENDAKDFVTLLNNAQEQAYEKGIEEGATRAKQATTVGVDNF
jgi:hypothetical protein